MLRILQIYDEKNTKLKEIQEENFEKIKDFIEKIIEENYEKQSKEIIIKINKRFGKRIKFLKVQEKNIIAYLKFEDYFEEEKESFIDYINSSLIGDPSFIKQFCVFDIPLIIGLIKKEMITLIELGLAVEVDGEDLHIIDQEKKVNNELGNELLRFLV